MAPQSIVDAEKQQTRETAQPTSPSPNNDDTQSISSDEVDEALKVYRALNGDNVQPTEAQARRVLRKIDFIMLPVMCLVYGLQYLDKTTLSYSSVMGITRDIHLDKNEYNWLASLFYFGYLAAEFPAQRLLQYLPLGKYLGTAVIIWGVILSCFAAVHDYSGAVALRFFLGFLEASIFPGFTLVTAQWWTKREQALRIALWVSFNGWAQMFGGFVAYGIARGNDMSRFVLAPWKVLYLFTGLLTVAVGFVYLAVVPDHQGKAWWLTPAERVVALDRVRANQQGIGNRKFKWYQFREALVDPLSWAIVFMAISSDIPNGALSNFFSLLITSFGYTSEQSLLYGTPAGAVEVVALLAWGWVSTRYGNRLLWALVPMVLSLIGACLVAFLPARYPVGRLVGYYFSPIFVVGLIALLSLISSNVAGYTKKTTVAVMFMIGYCVGNIVGPETFQAKDAPAYHPAEVSIVVLFALSILDLLFIYWWCRRLNAKKEAVRAAPGYKKRDNVEWLDLTDWENPEFVYEY